MDNLTCDSAKDGRLGMVSRTLTADNLELFAMLADPLAFSCRQIRFPSGRAIVFEDVPPVSEDLCAEEAMEYERWDGLA